MDSQEKAKELLSLAGVTLNGELPTDILVRDPAVFDRVFSHGSLGLGESYVEGQWDVKDLAGFFTKIFTAHLDTKLSPLSLLPYYVRATFTNMQRKSKAFEVGEAHYDLGNELYERMLDSRMVYSCGYWSGTPAATSLEEAQEAKLDLICRKIGLKPGDRVLDIGCGWGSFLKFAAENYGVAGVGITVSKEQASLARERCKGLPIEIKVEDYRDTTGQFDHVVSVGMFEHVGSKNYRTYMECVHRLLKDGGLFLLHTIGGNNARHTNDPWIEQYIFPNGVLPSPGQIGKAIEKLFVLEDWHNFGPDYDKTLSAWFENFNAHWPELKEKYGDRFYRMWKYYLLSCAGAFRARNISLWQIVLSKNGVLGGYTSVR